MMHRKISVVLTIVAMGGIGAFLATSAVARSATKLQRIAIVLDHFSSNAGTFKLTPMGSGPVHSDSGTVTSCCWTRHFFVRDGQSAEIDNPKLTFTGAHGTFMWRGRVTFVDSNNAYTVATAVWKITHGTGVYAHLEGHGRQAFVQKTAEGQNLADKAEGVVAMGG
jgi:hypothetical protein